MIETDSQHRPHSPRRPVAEIFDRLPIRFIEALEQNQQIPSCCRHPENNDISSWYSKPEEQVPDIYKFHCNTCGRVQVRFCVGGGERPDLNG